MIKKIVILFLFCISGFVSAKDLVVNYPGLDWAVSIPVKDVEVKKGCVSSLYAVCAC